MNDDQLRDRITASDPMHDGVPTESIRSAHAHTLLEAIVNTPLDDIETADSPDPAAPSGSAPVPLEPRRSRPRWFAPAIAVAAAAVLTVGGVGGMSMAGVFDGDDAPTVLALSTGDVDPAMMSCMAPDPAIVAESPIAFRAVVDSVDGEQVTMTVDTWYQGGDADQVELTAPAGMEALIGGLDFVPGETYLVSAYEGVVSYCGMTGPATSELQALYDAAFPG